MTFMDHGGFSEDDTHIACLISVNGATQTEVNGTFFNTQVPLAKAPELGHRPCLPVHICLCLPLTGSLAPISNNQQHLLAAPS
jgi:hypothetical protein